MAKVDMTGVPAEYLSESGRYKPGHDAKHVSHILNELKAEAKATGNGKIKVAALREAQKALPTQPLKEKLAKAVERFNNPPAKPAKAAEAEEASGDEGAEPSDEEPAPAADPSVVIRVEERQDVKFGRWFYPARTAFLEDGTEQVQRNTARDGSGEWVVAEG